VFLSFVVLICFVLLLFAGQQEIRHQLPECPGQIVHKDRVRQFKRALTVERNWPYYSFLFLWFDAIHQMLIVF
jgi:hypothetical protein